MAGAPRSVPLTPRIMSTDGRHTEEFKVSGANLKAKLKDIIRQGNVRRVVIKNGRGETILNVPLTAGIVGAALLPFWAAVGGIAALASDFSIEVERNEPTGITKK
jgi:uncharacterized protein DUF4342